MGLGQRRAGRRREEGRGEEGVEAARTAGKGALRMEKRPFHHAPPRSRQDAQEAVGGGGHDGEVGGQQLGEEAQGSCPEGDRHGL